MFTEIEPIYPSVGSCLTNREEIDASIIVVCIANADVVFRPKPRADKK